MIKEINSEMTNEQPTTADVSSIEEEDIQSNGVFFNKIKNIFK